MHDDIPNVALNEIKVEKMNQDIVRKKPIWKRLLLWGIIPVVALVGGVTALSILDSASTGNAAPIVNNAFGQQAQKAGAKTCAPLFSTLGQTMTEGSQFAASTFWNQGKPNDHSISAIVGQFYGDQTSRGAGIVYAAPVNGTCEGVMFRTVVSQESCQTVVAQQIPQEAQRQKDMGGAAVFRLPNGINIMLMPASETSCVVMTAVNLADTAK